MNDTLLAGPILRRVTENRVCVWLATDQRLNISLEILENNGSESLVGKSNTDNLYTECRQVGERLFIYLLEARCIDKNTFPIDTLLLYRLVITDNANNKKAFNLSEFSYFNENDKKTSEKANLPSFYIPSQLNQILYGSCRKPHGDNVRSDALNRGDEMLFDTRENIEQRPALLLLTGDQIYADDVSVGLLAMLRKQAKILIGHTEKLPVAGKDNTPSSVDPDTILLNDRKNFLEKNHSGFSSKSSHNHLLTFGEYAAMYIYVYGNAKNWKPEDDWNVITQEGVENVDQIEPDFDKQVKSLHKFHASLPKIRRLLANIPTYMLLDDHEITDDWNITNMWYDEVRDSTLGRRVVANGLAAYWAFQGWGNDPNNFDFDLKRSISEYLTTQTPGKDLSDRFDLHVWKHHRWGFSVPTNPPVIAIDSRTQRGLTRNSYLPRLLDRYALDWLVVEYSKVKSNAKTSPESCPIIITTTPVFGFAAVEFFQRLGLIAAKLLAALLSRFKFVQLIYKIFAGDEAFNRWVIQKIDIEAWASNSQSLRSLLKTMSQRMGIRQCIFLSGDVHYSFTAKGQYEDNIGKLQCYQLTSSSINNKPGPLQNKALKKLSKVNNTESKHTYYHRKRLHIKIPKAVLEKILPSFLAKKLWETNVKLLEDNKNNRIHTVCNLGMIVFNNEIPKEHHLLQEQEVEKITYHLGNIQS